MDKELAKLLYDTCFSIIDSVNPAQDNGTVMEILVNK